MDADEENTASGVVQGSVLTVPDGSARLDRTMMQCLLLARGSDSIGLLSADVHLRCVLGGRLGESNSPRSARISVGADRDRTLMHVPSSRWLMMNFANLNGIFADKT